MAVSSRQGVELCKSGRAAHLVLFPHNQRAYGMACRLLKEEGRAAVIHPTGTGKSFIAFRFVLDNPEAAFLWLSPSNYIFRTQLESLKKGLEWQTPIREVMEDGGISEKEELLKCVLENTEFMTYSQLALSAGSLSEKKLDYIILDEFHRCGAPEWGRGVQTLLSAHPEAKVLGLSATNIRYLDGQRDMAEEIFHGCVASKMTLGGAVAEKILPAPLYVISMYSYQKALASMEERIKNGRDLSLREQNEELLEKLRRSLEQADGLDAVFGKYMANKAGKYIVFCSGKSHMEEMVSRAGEWFCQVDKNPHIYCVSCDNPGAGGQFEAFCTDGSKHLKLLYCIDMLNEGVHVGGVDGVILLRPTVSPALYLQQVGRGLAVGRGREKQPIIFDIVNNFESLSSIDSLQGEFGQALAFAQCGRGVAAMCQNPFCVVDELLDCRAIFNAIQRNLSSPWEVYYQEAQAFYQREGHLEVKKRYLTESGLNLGAWLLTQRRVRAGTVAGNLDEIQVKRLDAIGMRWEDKKIRQFEEGLAELKQFVAENGHGDTGAHYVTEDGFPLGKWLSAMRSKQKSGSLEEGAVKKLEQAGMVWDVGAYRWEMYFQAAEEYKRKFGSLEIPAHYVTEDGKKLGIWLNNQKSCYQKMYGKTSPAVKGTEAEKAPGNGRKPGQGLTKEQAQKLEGLGVCWRNGKQCDREESLPKEKENSWECRCRLAEAYYKEHGNLEVSQQYVTEDGIWLGKWIYIQKVQYKKGVLENWKKERLEKAGVNFLSSSESAFERGCRALEEYSRAACPRKITKTAVMPDGYRLGEWVYRQKRKKRAGKLTKEQAERLGALGVE
ncbi:DEAD/DEAH box helicase [bacterium D16-59]|nr:DEAD/DEAH box helicase [bacterium D16-59]